MARTQATGIGLFQVGFGVSVVLRSRSVPKMITLRAALVYEMLRDRIFGFGRHDTQPKQALTVQYRTWTLKKMLDDFGAVR